MSETQNTEKPGSPEDPAAHEQRVVLDLTCFSGAELTRLAALRERFPLGDVTESLHDYKRLRFARWLYEQGRLAS
ncbi:MAG TPA: hypothetical protein VKY74_11920 [Chloroflexia bacterium]|nr:hypothetical protein [Chloroflexia bacterium]